MLGQQASPFAEALPSVPLQRPGENVLYCPNKARPDERAKKAEGDKQDPQLGAKAKQPDGAPVSAPGIPGAYPGLVEPPRLNYPPMLGCGPYTPSCTAGAPPVPHCIPGFGSPSGHVPPCTVDALSRLASAKAPLSPTFPDSPPPTCFGPAAPCRPTASTMAAASTSRPLLPNPPFSSAPQRPSALRNVASGDPKAPASQNMPAGTAPNAGGFGRKTNDPSAAYKKTKDSLGAGTGKQGSKDVAKATKDGKKSKKGAKGLKSVKSRKDAQDPTAPVAPNAVSGLPAPNGVNGLYGPPGAPKPGDPPALPYDAPVEKPKREYGKVQAPCGCKRRRGPCPPTCLQPKPPEDDQEEAKRRERIRRRLMQGHPKCTIPLVLPYQRPRKKRKQGMNSALPGHYQTGVGSAPSATHGGGNVRFGGASSTPPAAAAAAPGQPTAPAPVPAAITAEIAASLHQAAAKAVSAATAPSSLSPSRAPVQRPQQVPLQSVPPPIPHGISQGVPQELPFGIPTGPRPGPHHKVLQVQEIQGKGQGAQGAPGGPPLQGTQLQVTPLRAAPCLSATPRQVPCPNPQPPCPSAQPPSPSGPAAPQLPHQGSQVLGTQPPTKLNTVCPREKRGESCTEAKPQPPQPPPALDLTPQRPPSNACLNLAADDDWGIPYITPYHVPPRGSPPCPGAADPPLGKVGSVVVLAAPKPTPCSAGGGGGGGGSARMLATAGLGPGGVVTQHYPAPMPAAAATPKGGKLLSAKAMGPRGADGPHGGPMGPTSTPPPCSGRPRPLSTASATGAAAVDRGRPQSSCPYGLRQRVPLDPCTGKCVRCPVAADGCGPQAYRDAGWTHWPTDRGPCFPGPPPPTPPLPCGEQPTGPANRPATCTVDLEAKKLAPCKEPKTQLCRLTPVTRTLMCYERQPKPCVDDPTVCGEPDTCVGGASHPDRLAPEFTRTKLWPPPPPPPPEEPPMYEDLPPTPPRRRRNKGCMRFSEDVNCKTFSRCVSSAR